MGNFRDMTGSGEIEIDAILCKGKDKSGASRQRRRRQMEVKDKASMKFKANIVFSPDGQLSFVLLRSTFYRRKGTACCVKEICYLFKYYSVDPKTWKSLHKSNCSNQQ